MSLLLKLCSFFLTENKCFQEYNNNPLTTREIISLFISKILGVGIIAFSSLVKLPQIWKIIAYRRADGISLISIFLEVSVNVFSFSYHSSRKYPLTTYGETIVIFVQNIIIGFFVTHLEQNNAIEFWNFAVAFHMSLLFGVYKQIIPQKIIDMLWIICIPLSIINKIPQIILTHTQRKRGNYSRLSALLRAFGSLCRVFTTFREISDFSVQCSSTLNLILTLLIFVQTIIYPVDQITKDR